MIRKYILQKVHQKAEDYVDAAFDRCFRDTYPFDRHPNLR